VFHQKEGFLLFFCQVLLFFLIQECSFFGQLPAKALKKKQLLKIAGLSIMFGIVFFVAEVPVQNKDRLYVAALEHHYQLNSE